MNASDSPTDWTSTVVLGDGSTATIRPMESSDADALQAFHLRQSPESNYYRYFSPKPELSERELEHFTAIDMSDRVALVVEDHGEFIGWASYERWKGRPDAEVAFQVDDTHAGKGIATLLLEHLAAIARANGISRFTAETMGENRGMMAVFSRAGWPLQRRFESGIIDVDFPLETSAEYLDSVDRREQRADSRAVARLLMPRSIAVVGASDEPGSIGAALWAHTAAGGEIAVYPVNPTRTLVGGETAVNRVSDIEAEVDLAVIAVPTPQLGPVIEDCIAKRVRGAVLITAPADRAESEQMTAIVRRARRNGLRSIGPASMGISSPQPDTAINATLVDVAIRPGPIALSTQSGTLAASVLRLASSLDVGLSWFVSLGDKGDVSSNDLLQFWDDDDATKVICLYTESVGNPRKFARIAHRVAAQRPIIVLRTGSAMFGQSNDAMYRQSGVIEVPTVQAMLDTARVMAHQPVMAGNRVAVISNARNPRLAAQASLAAAGLELARAPIQLDWTATTDDYGHAVAAARDDDGIDALIVIHAPPTEEAVGQPNEAIAVAMSDATIPCCAVMLGDGDGALTADSGIASFAFPEQAVGVLSRIWSYSQWRLSESEEPTAAPTGIDRPDANELIQTELQRLSGTPTDDDSHIERPRPEMVASLLADYGIAMPTTRLVRAEDAVVAADEIGYPVAVKALRREPGSSVRAGIGLDLRDAGAVQSAVDEMRESLGVGASSVWVQRMVDPGFEMRATGFIDPAYGPVISTGLGGFDADMIGDVASRIAPMTPSSARHLLAETKAGEALDAECTNAMVDLVVRLAELVSDHPEIQRLDLNPIIVRDVGAAVVDAELVLTADPEIERPIRRLESN